MERQPCLPAELAEVHHASQVGDGDRSVLAQFDLHGGEIGGIVRQGRFGMVQRAPVVISRARGLEPRADQVQQRADCERIAESEGLCRYLELRRTPGETPPSLVSAFTQIACQLLIHRAAEGGGRRRQPRLRRRLPGQQRMFVGG
jgi:hypothetical protein